MKAESHVRLDQARELAEQVKALLAPACERIQIAGSIRREKPLPADIELVYIPKFRPRLSYTLFGDEEREPINRFDELIDRLLMERVLQHRLDVNGRASCGPWAKRLIFDGFPLDVFRATPETWGVTLAIRTGPATFSQQLASGKEIGGVLPTGWKLRGWRFWDAFGEPLDTPEEEDVFRVLGLPNWHPSKRK